MFKNIVFANPEFFWLLLLLPLMLLWYWFWNKKSQANVTFSTIIAFKKNEELERCSLPLAFCAAYDSHCADSSSPCSPADALREC